jgi:hypothetical protein
METDTKKPLASVSNGLVRVSSSGVSGPRNPLIRPVRAIRSAPHSPCELRPPRARTAPNPTYSGKWETGLRDRKVRARILARIGVRFAEPATQCLMSTP